MSLQRLEKTHSLTPHARPAADEPLADTQGGQLRAQLLLMEQRRFVLLVHHLPEPREKAGPDPLVRRSVLPPESLFLHG